MNFAAGPSRQNHPYFESPLNCTGWKSKHNWPKYCVGLVSVIMRFMSTTATTIKPGEKYAVAFRICFENAISFISNTVQGWKWTGFDNILKTSNHQVRSSLFKNINSFLAEKLSKLSLYLVSSNEIRFTSVDSSSSNRWGVGKRYCGSEERNTSGSWMPSQGQPAAILPVVQKSKSIKVPLKGSWHFFLAYEINV